MKELRVIEFLELLANDKIEKPKMIIFDENIYQLGGYDKMGSNEIIIGKEKEVYDYDYITTEDARYGNDWLSNNLFFGSFFDRNDLNQKIIIPNYDNLINKENK